MTYMYLHSRSVYGQALTADTRRKIGNPRLSVAGCVGRTRSVPSPWKGQRRRKEGMNRSEHCLDAGGLRQRRCLLFAGSRVASGTKARIVSDSS